MFKKILLAGAASTLMIAGAQAADVDAPAAAAGFDWTGAYVGVQAGYGWGDSNVDLDDADGDGPTGPGGDDNEIIVDALEGNIETDGFLGGLHVGYNFQADMLVFGVEGDIEFSDMNGDADVRMAVDGPVVGEATKEIDWLGSLRLRTGFAMDRALIYATGGLAVGGVEFESDVPGAEESNNETAWGWTIGGGLEYAMTDDLTARIEYRYTDLEDVEIENALGTASVENDFHAVRAGISWRFGN